MVSYEYFTNCAVMLFVEFVDGAIHEVNHMNEHRLRALGRLKYTTNGKFTLMGKRLFSLMLWIYYMSYNNSRIYVLLGLILVCAGLYFVALAKEALGSLYTHDIGLFNDHRLVTHGIYKYFRAPSTLGYDMFLIGKLIIVGVELPYLFAVMLIQINDYKLEYLMEREMLGERFGEAYYRYVNQH